MKLVMRTAILVVFTCSCLSAQEPSSAEFFETHIRPVLVKHCYECHAGEGDSVKGGLRVDWEAGLLAGGESGPAVTPGKPSESLLLSALRYEDFEMPPAGKLAPEIIANFETWIAQGAMDPRKAMPAETTSPLVPQSTAVAAADLWSFQPVTRPTIPVIKSTWPKTAIDQFVQAKLLAQNLDPIEDADPATLLRRIAFDLTGLPPTPEDVLALKQSPDGFNFEAYVQRVLDSQAYGEHWARHWLDVARYADSNGGDFNATFHDAWRYRNYVIDAFQTDMPFDQFIIEQIAGDQLPAASNADRHRQLVATGFLMLGAKMLSERDKLKLQMDVVDEQISAVGTAFLGLTLGCARCHDHKFDPIPTSDYYALAGIFNSTRSIEGEIQKYVSDWIRTPLPIEPEHAQELALFNEKLSSLKSKIKNAEKLVKQETSKAAAQPTNCSEIVLDDQQAELVGKWKSSSLTKPFVGIGYIHDENEEKGEKSVLFRTRLPTAGNYEISLAFQGGSTRAATVPIAITHAGGIAQLSLDQQKQGQDIYRSLGSFRFTADQDALVAISTADTSGFVVIDAVRFVNLDQVKEAVAAARPEKELAGESAEVTAAKATLAELNEQLKELQANAPPPAPTALAVQEAKAVGDCAICIRGEPHMPGNVIPRGFLTNLLYESPAPIPEQASGREQLARWIADPRHPLTARVYVNRVWNHLIGAGLVASVDNFGQLGQRPTHPELLDYLATQFTQHGWSTKWLVQEIVRSHVYQLASRADASHEAVDVENLLLWRAHRKRLSAESIRDTLLVSTESIDCACAESPVADLGTLVTQNNPNDNGYSQKATSQRTLYLPIIRNELPSLMRVFDFADPDFGEGDRPETTVPAQALWMLNSPFIRSQAEQLANKLLDTSSSRDERIELLYIRTLGRSPTPSEQSLANAFVNELPPGTEAKLAVNQWTDLVHAVLASSAFRITD